MQSLKSHYCREIKKGEFVKLAGWLSHKRQIGKDLFFFSLRDETGTVQVKLSKNLTSFKEKLDKTSIESVISVAGTVVQRPIADISQKMLGDLEVEAEQLTVLNQALDLPFSLQEKSLREDLRLQFRHVDLRRQFMIDNITKRQEIVKLVRRCLEDDFGFREFETPLLFKSTPEGASEFLGTLNNSFLVPANDPGYFYALPQSPQQLKQVLM
jgi:aspartyl-tRNA synthetase